VVRFVVVLTALLSLVLAACMQSPVPQEVSEPRVAFVHLFEWTWPAVARECEAFLGPAGYSAVQVSPPQEHVTGEQWWTRYQPVSYRLESRGGTRAQFEDMVQRCRSAGVDIYVDAIINHMTGVGVGVGVAGSEYGLYEYPVPYGYDDFHHCGRHGDDDIRDYQDAWEVRNCELAELADLDTGNESVRGKIAAYLDDLLELGVAGIRIDAAKHQEPEDIAAILGQLKGQPFVFQEVIDRGNEPIKGIDYIGNGHVTEFKYGMELVAAFTGRDLSGLESLGSGTGFLPPELAVVFVDMHDSQRGHGGASDVLTHKNWDEYELANIFMLAWPYGYPKVMSSYRFSDSDQGPPSTPAVDDNGLCGAEWVCEHRDPAIAAMVDFRRQTHGQPMTDWTQLNLSAIAFSRGDSGFVAINAGTSAVNARISVGLAPGRYQDLLGRGDLIVGEDQTVTISLPPMSAIATHVGVAK
jgi:alpha-amylase